VAGSFSEYLPHFALNALSGLDLAGRLRPLGGNMADEPPLDGHAEAEARGRREGKEAAAAEFERVRAELVADFDFRVAEKEQSFAGATAEALATQLAAGLATIEQAVATHVAGALAHFLEGAVRQRALDELAETMTALLASREAVHVRVAGPDALLGHLRPKLAGRGEAIEYVTDPRPEVTVTIDDTIMQTRIAAWGERIAAAGATDG
jgi:hypothetical protein